MPVYRGLTSVNAIYRGSVPVTAVYRGSTLVWTVNSIRDDFNRADTIDLSLGGGPTTWVEHTTGNVYKIGIVNNTCRMSIPDGLLFGIGMQTGYKRFSTAMSPDDDGYVEVVVSTVGDGTDSIGQPFKTQVFGRGANAASTHGVGFQLDQSTIRIVRRVAGTDTIMVNDCGTYAAGDRIRLTSAGNLHTLTCRGAFREEWNDSGATASKGAGFRSLLVRMDGNQDFLSPRRFSPALDYVEYG